MNKNNIGQNRYHYFSYDEKHCACNVNNHFQNILWIVGPTVYIHILYQRQKVNVPVYLTVNLSIATCSIMTDSLSRNIQGKTLHVHVV